MTQTPALILIIDDIPTNLGVMVDLLETEGHRVLVAKNGPEGMRQAESQQPDLILLDVMMPGETASPSAGASRLARPRVTSR